jgi:acyl-CoA synthetase (AMP-forming)/AMP-acid ligase II
MASSSSIFTSPYDSLSQPSVSFSSLIREHTAQYKDRVFLQTVTDSTNSFQISFTYRQFQALVDRVALNLHTRGFRKGDIVSIYSPNHVFYVVLVHACASLGVACATLNCQASVSELTSQLSVTRACAVFTSTHLFDKVHQALCATSTASACDSSLPPRSSFSIFLFDGEENDTPPILSVNSMRVPVLSMHSLTTNLASTTVTRQKSASINVSIQPERDLLCFGY